jgi:hypothetical protein
MAMPSNSGAGGIGRRTVGGLVCALIGLSAVVGRTESQRSGDQFAQVPVDPRVVLDEAQALTMRLGNRGVQALALLEIARVREPADPTAAQELTRRVADILPDLPAASTFGDMLKDGLSASNLLGSLATNAISGPYVSNAVAAARFSEGQQTRRNEYETRKAELTVQLFEKIGKTDLQTALATAQKLDPLFRTIALEALLRVAPQGVAGQILPSVRQLLQGKKDDIVPLDLALLAEATHPHDPELARSILTEALSKLKTDSAVNLLETLYVSAVRVNPTFDFDPAKPPVGRDIHARRQLAFAHAIARTDAARALKLITAVTHDSQETRQRRAATLRLIAEHAPRDLAEGIRAESVRLLDHRQLSFLVARDALIALGLVDPDLARQRSFALPRPSYVLSGMARAELALSWLSSHPARAFEILEGLDDKFWQETADGAWKTSSMPSSRNLSFSLIARTKRLWPQAAADAGPMEPAVIERTLRRFENVARLLDKAIVNRLPDKMGDRLDFRAMWVSYSPFATTELAVARQRLGHPDARKAFEEARQIALKAQSPTQEWALAFNARAWIDGAPGVHLPALDEAADQVTRLNHHGHLDAYVVDLIRQVTGIRPDAAVALARRAKNDVRPFALAAVADELQKQPR